MGRLSIDSIATEVLAKGYILVDASEYKNMDSEITLTCPKGHTFKTTLANFRLPSFSCPECDKGIKFVNPTIVPQKKGYRVIAFDQATERFGLSVYDGGELVFFNLYNYVGHVADRLAQIKNFVQNIVIKEWKPDYIVMEDIQYQYGNVLTYKILAMLLGVLETVCTEEKIPYEVVSPNVWRKYAGTCGKTRLQEKQMSVALVKEKYGVRVNDDVAEAILIGRYGAQTHKGQIEMAFGRKN